MDRANRYNTWQDLLDEEDQVQQPSAPLEARAQPVDEPAPDGEAPPEVDLPSDLVDLMAEKERLQKKLDALTGQAAPDQEEERQAKMYPVKVHTKETRIEERRLRRRDEEQHLLKQRVLERRSIRRKATQREFEQKETQQRRFLAQKKQAEERLATEQEILANQQRRDLEKAVIARRFAERQAWAQRKRIRRNRETEKLYNRWDTARRRLVAERLTQRRAERQALDRHFERTTRPKPPPDVDFDDRRRQTLERAQQQALARAQTDEAQLDRRQAIQQQRIQDAQAQRRAAMRSAAREEAHALDVRADRRRRAQQEHTRSDQEARRKEAKALDARLDRLRHKREADRFS